ncbi:hypothetical protein DPMN_147600 [Dreissena polymorpha]|uniref:Uncharacterized protein n=1 Tax=Dreissena polymorpha TaxID=45954 RepID=A0A9D4FA62_DREPO|nr:hypothetical protein DPMN_147600 [Dreissena polymorpha]
MVTCVWFSTYLRKAPTSTWWHMSATRTGAAKNERSRRHSCGHMNKVGFMKGLFEFL